MLRYAPALLSMLALTGAAVYNGTVTNRWTGGASQKAETCAAYLELIPKKIGPWEGRENEPIDEEMRDKAGVVGEPISRTYTHRETGRSVDLWLIVGHSNAIIRHTPNVCLKAANFIPAQGNPKHFTIAVDGVPPAQTWTNVYHKELPGGDVFVRVFWMWNRPIPGAAVRWVAPGHVVSDARYKLGGAKALYKMYLTTKAEDGQEAPGESPAVEFAADLFPVLDGLLKQAAEGKQPAADAGSSFAMASGAR